MGCKTEEKIVQMAANGKLEINNWDFQKDGPLSLNGKWEFYPQKLLELDQILKTSKKTDINFIKVPGSWNNYTYSNNKLDNNGYATYRLNVKCKKIPEGLAIKNTILVSACKIWIDNSLVLECGNVSTNRDNFKAQLLPQIIPIFPTSKNFNIIVQITNFDFEGGGFLSSMKLGKTIDLMNSREQKTYLDMFLFGSIIIIAFYHLILYLFQKKDKSALYFSIMCLMISLRTLLMGEMILYRLFQFIPMAIFLKISLLTLSIGQLFFILFVRSIFPKQVPNFYIKFSVSIILIYSVSVLIFSDAAITPFFNVYKILAIIILVYLFYIFIKAIKCHEIGSVLSLIALIVIVCFSVNDILNEYMIIKTAYVIPFGILIFLIIQATMISKKFVEKENMRLRAEIKALQSQIKPHFLFNSLNTIISVIRVCPEKSIKLLIDLCDFLRYSFNFKFEDEFIDITKEISHVNAYLSLEKARFKERLNIDFQIEESINGKVPSFIFQPIVENAVKHGIMVKIDGGNIKISAKNHDKFLLLSVEDNGVGIEKEKINKILENACVESGIGLINVHNRLKNIYGTGLNIDSVIGKGTMVSIKIPT